MTNNQLCNLIGGAGLLIAAVSFTLCFVGVGAWVALVIGILLMGVSQVSYD